MKTRRLFSARTGYRLTALALLLASSSCLLKASSPEISPRSSTIQKPREEPCNLFESNYFNSVDQVDHLRYCLSRNRWTWLSSTAAASFGTLLIHPAIAISTLYWGIGSYVSIMRPPFSSEDESTHITYIEYLAAHRRIPSALQPWVPTFPNRIIEAMGASESGKVPAGMPFYEGFQPPIGYTPSAIILYFSQILNFNFIQLFLILRLFGVFLVGSGLGLFVFSQARLARHCPHLDLPSCALFSAALCISPQYLKIMAVVTNDQTCALVLALVALTSVQLISYPASRFRWLTLGVFCGLTWLSKMTWLSVSALAICVALFQKPSRWREVTLPLLFIVTPWHLFNLYTYHALTGTKAHLNFVLPILNPNRHFFAAKDLLQKAFIEYFGGYFSLTSSRQSALSLASGLLFLIATAAGLYRGIFRLTHEFLRRGPLCNSLRIQDFSQLILSLAFLFPLALTTLMTIRTGGWFVLARYAFALAPGLATLVFIFLRSSGLPRAVTRLLALSLFLVVASETINFTAKLPFRHDHATHRLIP